LPIFSGEPTVRDCVADIARSQRQTRRKNQNVIMQSKLQRAHLWLRAYRNPYRRLVVGRYFYMGFDTKLKMPNVKP